MVCCFGDRDTGSLEVERGSIQMTVRPGFQAAIPGDRPLDNQPLTTPHMFPPVRFQEPEIQRPEGIHTRRRESSESLTSSIRVGERSWRVGSGNRHPPHFQTAPVFPPAVPQVWGATPSPSPRETLLTGQSGDALQGSSKEKLTISIDFGTTFSGVAYGSPNLTNGEIKVVLNWPGYIEKHRKIPTILLYDEHGGVLAWGLSAAHSTVDPGQFFCDLFKLFLYPENSREPSEVDDRLPKLPPGKRPVDLIGDYLRCMWEHCREEIIKDLSGNFSAVEMADIWLMVPPTWGPDAAETLKEAAFNSGIVELRDHLRVMTEPQAASIHCAGITNDDTSTPNAVLRAGHNFMVCDAGGGSVDIAVHKVIGTLSNLEIAEISAQTSSMCGSIFLDLRFRDLVKTLMLDHPVHSDLLSLRNFEHNFSEGDKLSFFGNEDDAEFFHFSCFNVEDPDDPAVGLINGSLSIPGILLRQEVFDPVIDQVVALINEQVQMLAEPIHTLFMVGGFAENPYLFKRIKHRFGDVFNAILRPHHADTAALRGAVKYGMAGLPLISSVIAPHSYVMKVRLPADSEDQINRPNYISRNAAGTLLCEKRLQYLITKGAIIKKGERIRTKFSKYSKDVKDSKFVAVIYTTDAAERLRYTDQGHLAALCRWTVDLQALPSFQYHANTPEPVGFYTGKFDGFPFVECLLILLGIIHSTFRPDFPPIHYKEFEVGLELDSAEVRGVLLFNGQEWGRVIFDFLT